MKCHHPSGGLHNDVAPTPRDLVPVPPALREPSTGLTMGEHAEMMAKEAGLTRDEQDRVAHRSHSRAAAAWDRGLFDAEVMHVLPPPSFDRPIAKDNLVRSDSKPESYATLRPVFDPKYGTVTAGNSSPLTDGASALLLMRESKAKALERVFQAVHANDADPKVLAYKYLEMLPRLAEHGNGYFVIPGELTEAVKTVTSAFASDRAKGGAAPPSGNGATPSIESAKPSPQSAVEAAAQAAEEARAAVDEAKADAEDASHNILG